MIPDIMGGVFRKVGMPATAFVTPYVFFQYRNDVLEVACQFTSFFAYVQLQVIP